MLPTPAPTMSLEEDTGPARTEPGQVTALAIAWSRDEPHRVGEVVMVPGGFPGASLLLGRAPPVPGEAEPHGVFVRQRPGASVPTGPVGSPHVSRDQLRLRCEDEGLRVTNLGRCVLLHNGAPAGSAPLAPGDVLELRGSLVLVCVHRPFLLPAAPAGAPAWPGFAFGRADRFGIVGESAAAWDLRHRVAFAAGRNVHVFVGGPSGSGKELVAQAIHGLSERSEHPLVSRNAATLPEGLVDAELFGNTRNYPNPGMAERKGLVGEADGSSLFLDEFGELPPAAQAHLLRVLDSGEYHRLGEGRARRSDFRLLAATNRDVDELKEDVAARLRLRILVPDLNERREDVPLLVRHLLVRLARQDRALAERFFPGGDLEAWPRVSAALVTALLRRAWRTQVRELEGALWEAMQEAGDTLDVPADWSSSAPEVPGSTVDPSSVTPEMIVAALARAGGRQAEAWKDLGLSSRHVLARLVKRHGIR